MTGTEFESDPLTSTLGPLVGRVHAGLTAAMNHALQSDGTLAPLELSCAQFVVIDALATMQTPRSAADLCKILSYDAGAMTRMLDRLRSKGLLRGRRCTQDRRLTHISLTETGLAVYPRMVEVFKAQWKRYLRGFARSEERQLRRFLARMLENAQASKAT